MGSAGMETSPTNLTSSITDPSPPTTTLTKTSTPTVEDTKEDTKTPTRTPKPTITQEDVAGADIKTGIAISKDPAKRNLNLITFIGGLIVLAICVVVLVRWRR